MSNRILLLLVFITLNVPSFLVAQSIVEAREIDFDSCMAILKEYLPISLAYASYVVPDGQKFNLSFKSTSPWRSILRHVLDQADLDYRVIDKNAILIPKEKYWYQGYIYDAETGESLPGAHLELPKYAKGWIANDDGYYQMSLSKGRHTLKLSYLGYQVKILALDVRENQRVDLFLEGSLDLPLVTVTDSLLLHQKDIPAGAPLLIEKEKLNQFPSLGHAMDVSRYLQFVPGVSTGGDGFGGMHIRGGGSAHNMILLDDIPIYNSLHMLGTTSIFNGDAIQQITLSKNYFSPKYSGRLSSVLNVRLRDGNRDSPVINAGVSALSAHAVVETPILSGRGTLMVAGQRSHVSDLVRMYSRNQKSFSDIDGFFQPAFRDYYGKTLIDLTDKDKLILNFYSGSDNFIDVEGFSLENDHGSINVNQFRDEYQWGNTAGGLRWLHSSPKFFFKTNVYLSRYRYQSINGYISTDIDRDPTLISRDLTEFRSSVNEAGLDHEVHFMGNRDHFVTAGLGLRLFHYTPGIIAYDQDRDFISSIFDKKLVLPELPASYFDELHLSNGQIQGFLKDHWIIDQHWSLECGFHTRLFLNEGASYFSFEPRASLQLRADLHQFDFSYSHIQQPQHLISITDNGLPNELWVPSSANIKPQKMSMFDLSADLQLTKQTNWRFSCYYKYLENLTSFVENPNFLNSGRLNNVDASAWEEELIVGKGNSWGIENNVRFESKKYFLNLNYTLAKSRRQFDQKYAGYNIPYAFERPHEFSFLAQWQASAKIDLSMSWQWGSGVALPLTQGEYDIYNRLDFFEETITVPPDELELLIMPAYHRLDLSTSFKIEKKRCIHSFKLSLINLYDANNISFASVEYGDHLNAIRFIGGLPLIPSLAYHLSFQ